MLSQLAFVLALAGSTPETVPIIPLKGGLTLDAKVGGVSGRFFLSTAWSATRLTPEFLAKLPKDDSGQVEVMVGSVRLDRVTPSEVDLASAYPGVDGIIGAECLKNVALGIDSDGLQLRLWPGGVSNSEAQGWVEEAVPLAKVAWLPVDVKSGGAFVRARFGGRDGKFAFDTTMAKPEIRRAALPKGRFEPITTSESGVVGYEGAVPVDVVATNDFLFGESIPLWSIVRRRRIDDPGASDSDGFITPRSLLSRRIVLDFKNARMGYDVPTLDEAIGRSLSGLTSLWIRVDGSRLAFIRPLDGSADKMRRLLVGGELVEYEGLPAAEILASMRAGGEKRLKVLAVFAHAFDDGFKGKILLNGKVRDLEVSAPSQ